MIVNPPFAQGGIPLSAYWRIHITDAGTSTGGSNYVRLSNVEFRALIGGSNVATGGTPTASTTDATSSAVTVLFNGNTDGQWFSDKAGALPVNIDYHFTSAQRIAEIALSFVNAAHAGGVTDLNHAPLKFNLQYSLNGGSSYNTLWTFDMTASGWVPGYNSTSRFAVFSSPVWYQLYIEASPGDGSGHAYQCAEAELHAVAGGSNLAVGGFTSATSWQTYIATVPNFPAEPFGNTDSPDYVGNGGYGWLSAQNPTAPVHLDYGFYYPASTMHEMKLTMLDSPVVGFFNSMFPSQFKIRKSTDFSTWTNLSTQTSVTWTSGVSQSFSW